MINQRNSQHLPQAEGVAVPLELTTPSLSLLSGKPLLLAGQAQIESLKSLDNIESFRKAFPKAESEQTHYRVDDFIIIRKTCEFFTVNSRGEIITISVLPGAVFTVTYYGYTPLPVSEGSSPIIELYQKLRQIPSSLDAINSILKQFDVPNNASSAPKLPLRGWFRKIDLKTYPANCRITIENLPMANYHVDLLPLRSLPQLQPSLANGFLKEVEHHLYQSTESIQIWSIIEECIKMGIQGTVGYQHKQFGYISTESKFIPTNKISICKPEPSPSVHTKPYLIQIPYVLTTRLPMKRYCFYDEDFLCQYIIQEYEIDGKIVQIPIAYFSSGDSNYEHCLPCLPDKHLLFNLHLIAQYPGIDIIISPLVYYAQEMAFSTLTDTEVLYSSWWGGAETAQYVNISGLEKRNVTLLLHVGSELDDKDCYEAVAAMSRHIDNSALLSFSYYNHQSGEMIEGMNQAKFEELVTSLGFDSSPLKKDRSDNSNSLVSFKLKPEDEIENIPVAISDFALSVGIIMLIAPPKLGKTSLLIRFLNTFSTGGEVLGHKCRKMRVMLVDTESSPFGLQKLGVAAMQSKDFHIFTIVEMLANSPEDKLELLDRVFDNIEEYVDMHNIQVIGVDALYSFINESSQSQVKVFLRRAVRLKAKGKLVILVHHTRKDVSNKNNIFANMAGHSDLQRNFNAGLMLCGTDEHIIDEEDQKCPVMELHYQSRDFAYMESKKLYFGSDRKHHIVDQPIIDDLFPDTPKDLLPLAHFIHKHLPRTVADALTTTELVDLMDEDGSIEWTRETLKKKLPTWTKDGYLRSTGKSPKRYYIGKKIEQQ